MLRSEQVQEQPVRSVTVFFFNFFHSQHLTCQTYEHQEVSLVKLRGKKGKRIDITRAVTHFRQTE